VEVLAPGESAFVKASHMVTQSDLDAGEIVNIARAAGSDRKGAAVANSGNRVVVTAVQQPVLAITTAASVDQFRREGDPVEYTVSVTNTGNVTLSDVHATDAKVMLDFTDRIPLLAPGETATVKAVHAVTLEDINAGRIITAGIAHGTVSSQQHSFRGNDVTVRMFIENFNLSNFPNPFNYETTITFDLDEDAEVIIKVYDVSGREVGIIDQTHYNRGRNYVKWKTLSLQQGLYVIKMYSGGQKAVRMISVAK
jgi:hypothetical protein